MLAIGIDPGLGGAIAWTADGKTVETINMPDKREEILDHLRDLNDEYASEGVLCVVEKLSGGSPMRGGKFQQKRSTMWKMGQNYGEINMALHALNIRTDWIGPRVWQKAFGLVMPVGTKNKKSFHKDAAAKLYPGCKPTLKTCDAILLTYFARQRGKRMKASV